MTADLERVLEVSRAAAPGSGKRRLPGFLLVLAVMILPVYAADNNPVAPQLTDADIDTAIARGNAWLVQHPASVSDGGLPDILDEGVGYYVRRNLSRDDAEQARLVARLREHMTRLADLPEFEQWVFRGRKNLTDYYHLVLAAHLLKAVADPDNRQEEIINQAKTVLRLVPYCDPTKRLTIALFLQQLGADPGISLPAALENSRIERIAQGRALPLPPPGVPGESRAAASLELYALVHEIVALTDFGSLPAPPWLVQRRDAVVRYLGEAVAWTAATGNVDLMAELLICARLLHQPLTGNYRDAVLAITAGQQADGSWGSQPTRRKNRRRHAVLTATTALWVYRNAPAALQEGDPVVY